MDENGRLKKIQKVSFWELGFLKIQVQNCCRLVSGRLTIDGKSAELGKSSHPFSTSELELDLNTFRKKKRQVLMEFVILLIHIEKRCMLVGFGGSSPSL